MRIIDLLVADRVRLDGPEASDPVETKRQALEHLGGLLAGEDGGAMDPPATAITEALSVRERLGSTGLGHGVAIPHGRMAALATPRVALLRLAHGVDFEAIDHEPVDILVALVVPEDATGEHLELLAQLARGLSQPDHIAALRRATNSEALFHAAQAAFGDARST